ncbi:hypothetical protein RB2150_11651 [Rhodobacteraceae bacterium HTCC2150]|nr:hypothetical protein RB2150_11651 [Rhodobacteraceae bacterium HTCC2150]
MLAVFATATHAEPIRIATYKAALTRKGPGLLLSDILKGRDAQIQTVIDVIVAANVDVLVLTDFDYDAQSVALREFANALAEHGAAYPFHFSRSPNTGMPTGLDFNKNGHLGEPQDAQGFGWFQGQGGVAVLSRLPFGDGFRDFSDILWADFPQADLPILHDQPYYSPTILRTLRLASTVLWQLPLQLSDQRQIDLLIFYATTPVFDGPEDRNGKRNAHQMRFWVHFLNGKYGPFSSEFALIGDANLDPNDGAGHNYVMRQILDHPMVNDPKQTSDGGGTATQTDANANHETPNAQDTAQWSNPNGPGNLRVDYVLPSTRLKVVGSGVFWPSDDRPLNGIDQETVVAASSHRLVWVDVE